MENKNDPKEVKTTLIDELSSNRPKLYTMLETISEFRKKMECFLPSEKSEGKSDFRSKDYNKFAMQENMKHVTEILKAELDVHKAIEGSIKAEFELRSKADPEENLSTMEGSFDDIRSMLKNMDPQTAMELDSLIKVVSNRE